ncbi:MAG: hypothetical protein ACYCO5_05495 [Acidobacteriaceae bacterium]
MPSKVINRILDSMIHQIVCGFVIMQICPGAKKSVWPSRLSSGLHYLIRSWMPG